MNKLNLLKTAFTEGCVFYTLSLTAVYLIGCFVNAQWVPTLAMVLGLLFFSMALGLLNRFLFSDSLIFPLRLLLHYGISAVIFWICFGVLGNFTGSGLTVWLVYTFAYALIMTIVLAARWLMAEDDNRKQDYEKKFKDDNYRPSFGGKKE